MANPTATASLNKSTYAIGEVITLTINHTDADRQSIVVAGTVTDSQGNTATWQAGATIDAGVVAITQSGGKVWALQTASANQSVYTTTA